MDEIIDAIMAFARKKTADMENIDKMEVFDAIAEQAAGISKECLKVEYYLLASDDID